jgi:anti-sigma factor ChrR (cupin superfamily)
MEGISEYEELQQVAESAFTAWKACNVGVDLKTVEDELEWEALIEAMGTLGAVLHNQAAKQQG